MVRGENPEYQRRTLSEKGRRSFDLIRQLVPGRDSDPAEAQTDVQVVDWDFVSFGCANRDIPPHLARA